MKTLPQVLADGERFNISLTKLAGPIKDILGHVSMEFGEPVFKLNAIVFESGKVWVEGEHDMPYLSGAKNVPGLAVEQLQALHDEEANS